MRFRSLCLVMVLLASPFAAQAQPFQGLYIGAGAGVYWPESINVQTAVLGSSRTQLDPSVGFAGLASVGYALGNGFRFELEGNYRTADISRGTGPGLSTFSGTAQTYGALANVLFDMDVHLPWLYPYVGGGVGYGWTHLRNLAVTPLAGSPTGVITSNDTAGRARLSGDRRPLVPDAARAGPFSHRRVPVLRDRRRSDICRHRDTRPVGRFR